MIERRDATGVLVLVNRDGCITAVGLFFDDVSEVEEREHLLETSGNRTLERYDTIAEATAAHAGHFLCSKNKHRGLA